MFGTECIVISTNFAISVGVLPEGVLESVFAEIEGRKYVELCYTNDDGTRVELCDDWFTVNVTDSPFVFRVVPSDCVFPALLARKQAQFDAMHSLPIVPSDTKSAGTQWFDQFARRRAGESDVELEHRIMQILAALFTVFKRRRESAKHSA